MPMLGVAAPVRMHWFTVPVTTFLWLGRGRPRTQLLRGELVVEPRAHAGSAEAAADWMKLLRGDPARRRLATLEIEALVLRLGLDGVSLGPPAAPGAPAATRRAGEASARAVEAMCRYLAERYGEAVSVAGCAAAGGLSQAHAMAVFRRSTGLTMLQYLTRLRLAHAQRLLLTSERSVLSIALDAGFGSQARFYAAFRRAFFATTPAALRMGRRACSRRAEFAGAPELLQLEAPSLTKPHPRSGCNQGRPLPWHDRA